MFPASLPRTLSALRFSSFFGFLLSIYIVIAVVLICIFNRDVVPNLGESFKVGITNFDISVFGIFNSLPLIIFAYMYQMNIPMIYVELEKKDLKHMWKVMVRGTVAATIAYIMVGIFGYVTFAAYPEVAEIMDIQNILKAPPYGDKNIAIYISLFGMCMVVLFACPLTILPCKDTLEEILFKDSQRFNKKQNLIWTFVLCALCFVISIGIPNIGDCTTILGATTNSAIGFILPVIYYLKIDKKAPAFSPQKIACYCTLVFICIASVIELVTFAYKKTH